MPNLFLQNRYLPIIGFSLHVYWRVNRSIDNPVCMGLPKYHSLTVGLVVGYII